MGKMKFIENEELREWVKDNLKKTIFQKAHSLAVQTGCEILVKMKDLTDPTTHQYYATGSLQRAYHANAMKRVPGERTVSGETGMPSVDQSVQMGTLFFGGDGNSISDTDDVAVPLHLSVENAEAETSTDGVTVKFEMDDGTGSSQSEQGLMTDDQMAFSMDSMDTSQTSYQEGFGMAGQGTNTQKHSVPITPKPYQCAMCHKAFRSVQVLQKHTQTFHMRPGHSGSGRGRGRGKGLNQFAKTLAYKQQTQQALISRQAELQSQSFTCVICNQTFQRPELLSEHITNSHSDENSLAATLPGLPSQFEYDPQGTIGGDVGADMSQSQALAFPHGVPSGLDLSAGSGMTQQQQQPYVQSLFKYHQSPKQSSSPGRPSTSTGSTGTALKRKWSFQRKEVTIRTIMSAILLSAGPISTHYAVRRYGPKYLRTPSIPKEQYVLAATALQEAKLGMLVTVKNATGLSDTFIKRAPSEIVEDLQKNNDLATLEEYTFRFHAPPPACITPTMQASIIQHGLLPPGSFSEKVRPQSSASHSPSQIHDLRLLQIPTSYVPTLNVPSGKMKKDIVTPIYTPSSQASMPDTLPTMVPFPDPTMKQDQAITTTILSDALTQNLIPASSADSLPTMVTANVEDMNQDLDHVSSGPGNQATTSSTPDTVPTMVSDDVNQDIIEIPGNENSDSQTAQDCESGSIDNDPPMVQNT